MLALLLSASAFASTLTNGGFDSPSDLWDAPSGWSASWPGCSTGCWPLPAFGPIQPYAGPTGCGATAPANLSPNLGDPYVRVVDGHTIPGTAGLYSTSGSPQSCEVFSSRPSARCASGAQTSWVEQSVVLPSASGYSGHCVSFSWAAVLQSLGTATPAAGDAHVSVEMLVNGNPAWSSTGYANSASVVTPSSPDAEGLYWRHLPWTFVSPGSCLPAGVTVAVRLSAVSSDGTTGSRWALGYLDDVSDSPCCPFTPTVTVTPTITLTPTISETGTESPTTTDTATISRTPSETRTESPTATPTPTFVGGLSIPYLRTTCNVCRGDAEGWIWAQWILDRDLRGQVRLYDSAGQILGVVWEGRFRKHQVDQARFPLTFVDHKKKTRTMGNGVYLLAIVAEGYVLKTRFAVVR